MKNLFIWGLVLSFVLCSCSNQHGRLYRIQENGLYGFIDSLGNVVISPQYKYVSPFTKNGFATVISSIDNIDENQIKIKYGVIDSNNKIIVDTTMQAILPSNGVMTYSKQVTDSLIALYQSNNLSFNSALFPALIPSSKLIAVQNPTNKLWGYMSLDGDTVVQCKYHSVRGYYHGLSVVVEPSSFDPQKELLEILRTWGIIDTEGRKITKSSYNMIMDFGSDNTWAISVGLRDDKVNTEYSLLDKSGKTILGPFPVYQGLRLYNGSDDRFVVEANFLGIANYNFIDSTGKFLITGENSSTSILDEFLNVGFGDWAEDVTAFSDSICGMKVKYQDKIGWMFLDRNLKLASYEVYDSVGHFSEGLAAVKEYSGILNEESNDLPKGSRKWGFVNHDFKQIIPYRFSEVGAFYNALCYFKLVGNVTASEGYINKKGDIIWQHNIKLN